MKLSLILRSSSSGHWLETTGWVSGAAYSLLEGRAVILSLKPVLSKSLAITLLDFLFTILLPETSYIFNT